jgi:glucose/arabinose dehydrogenase
VKRLAAYSLAGLLALLIAASLSAATVPDGFEDMRVTTFDGALSLAVLPDKALLIAGCTGELRVFRDGKLSNPAISLRDRICGDQERRLLGVAVDPHSVENRHVYLFTPSTSTKRRSVS